MKILLSDRIRSGQIVSDIESSSVGSFQVSGRIRSGRVGYRVISDFGSYQAGSGQITRHLVSGHFRFQVVLCQVGSVIRSSSVGSFRISDHIRLGRIGYRSFHIRLF
jgi:hypothetical protein